MPDAFKALEAQTSIKPKLFLIIHSKCSLDLDLFNIYYPMNSPQLFSWISKVFNSIY